MVSALGRSLRDVIRDPRRHHLHWPIQVARRDCRHGRDPQPFGPIRAALPIDHRIIARAHPAGAAGMKVTFGISPDNAAGLNRRVGRDGRPAQPDKHRPRHQIAGLFDPIDHLFQAVRATVIVEPDQRRICRICRPQDNRAPAV